LSFLFIDPILIFNLFEQVRHKLLKLLIVSGFVADLLVNFVHEVIDDEHNKVIVVTLFPVFKRDATGREVVVLQ
jgi:hypothetical protein